MCRFANIHNHTDVGSFDAVLTADSFIKRILDLGQEYVVQTDHGTMRGMIGLAKKARKAGLKYIPAIEVYTTFGDTPQKGTDHFGRSFYHMLLIAKNKKGLENLFNLNLMSYKSDGHFYRKPRVGLEEIRKHSEGLIATTGCIASPLSTIALLESKGFDLYQRDRNPEILKQLYLMGKTCDDFAGEQFDPSFLAEHKLLPEHFGTYGYEKTLDYLLGIFGDNLYGEVQDCGEPDQDIVNKYIFEYARKKGMPVVATSDAHYASPEDAKVRELMLRIRHKQLDVDDNNEFYEGGRLHLKSAAELSALFGEEPIQNTIRLVESCSEIALERSTLFPVPLQYLEVDRKEVFRTKIKEGLKKRKIFEDNPRFDEYKKRIIEEFETITQLGFADYFLVLEDILRKARERGILIGCGRGSVAGSLIAYLLGITEIDSLKYDLLFSRFLNKDRVSLPDIDIDIMSSRRDEFIQMVTDEYGEENVCQIMTFLQMKPKSIARDLGRIFKTPELGAEIARLIPPPLHGREATVEEALEQVPQLREDKYRTIVSLMSSLEALSRTSGVHAGGLVISPEKLQNYVPLEYKKDKPVVGLEMSEIESAGLIKFDFLGLRNLDVIDMTMKAVGISNPYEEIPLDDLQTFEELSTTKDYGGFFQFEGSEGISDLLRNIQPKSIEDIAIATALYRPGPLGANMDKMYLEQRSQFLKGNWRPKDKYEEVLKSTYGTLIYQEQILKICTQIAGFSEPLADTVRRAIGKKDKVLMQKYRNDFISGCVQVSGFTREYAELIWNDIEKNADYGFNASHSYSYAYLTYITAYLRTHYKEHYMAALLNASKDNKSKFLKALKTASTLGIEIRAPLVSRLEEECFVEDSNIIRLGTSICKNLKKSGAYAVQAARKNPSNLFEFIRNLDRTKLNVRAAKAMVSAGTLDEYTFFGDYKLNRTALRKLVEDYYEWFRKFEIKLENWERWNERKKIRAEQEKLKANGLPYGDRLKAVGKEPVLPAQPDSKDYLEIPDKAYENALSEYEILGCTIGAMPTEFYQKNNCTTIEEIKKFLIENFDDVNTVYYKGTIIGIISEVKEIRTSTGKQMASLLVEDESDSIQLTIFPNQYEKLKALIGKPEELQIYKFDVTGKIEYNTRTEESEITLVYNSFSQPALDKNKLKYHKSEDISKANFISFQELIDFLSSNSSFVGEIYFNDLKGYKYARKDSDHL